MVLQMEDCMDVLNVLHDPEHDLSFYLTTVVDMIGSDQMVSAATVFEKNGGEATKDEGN